MYIQDVFVRLYDIRPTGISLLDKIIGNGSKVVKPIANVILPSVFKKRKGVRIQEKNKKAVTDAIVCVTSFPQRIPYLWLVIECMLRQTMCVKKIVLYLSKVQFPNMLEDIPENLMRYCKNVLDIRFVEGDIRSHKKYWYAVKDFPNTPIITIDDDLIYASDTIELLTNYAHQYKRCVSCMYAHRMRWDEQGQMLPYSQLLNIGRIDIGIVTDASFFGSGGGTYFPVGSLKDADSDFELIKSACPMADDIWLNAIIRKNGFKTITPRYQNSVPDWTIKENQSLSHANNGENMNDIQLNKTIELCEKLFGINPFKKVIL